MRAVISHYGVIGKRINRQIDMNKVNVLCMKWGTKYPAKYVNVLYAMVKRNLTKPFRFICLTDDKKGLHNDIDVFDIPSLALNNGPERGWDKLTSFISPFYDITGTVLFLDLDVVIVDNIDSFFEEEGDFLIIRDWVLDGVIGNSSVYRYEAGKYLDILEYFKENYSTIIKQYRNEQAYLSYYVQQHYQLSYWPDTWCKSFKYHCVEKFPKQWFVAPKKAEGAKIIVFHGNPNPPDAIEGVNSKWYRKVLPTKWLQYYWYE